MSVWQFDWQVGGEKKKQSSTVHYLQFVKKKNAQKDIHLGAVACSCHEAATIEVNLWLNIEKVR